MLKSGAPEGSSAGIKANPTETEINVQLLGLPESTEKISLSCTKRCNLFDICRDLLRIPSEFEFQVRTESTAQHFELKTAKVATSFIPTEAVANVIAVPLDFVAISLSVVDEEQAKSQQPPFDVPGILFIPTGIDDQVYLYTILQSYLLATLNVQVEIVAVNSARHRRIKSSDKIKQGERINIVTKSISAASANAVANNIAEQKQEEEMDVEEVESEVKIAFKIELKLALKELSCHVSDYVIKKLVSRNSSTGGAVNDYFSNFDFFAEENSSSSLHQVEDVILVEEQHQPAQATSSSSSKSRGGFDLINKSNNGEVKAEDCDDEMEEDENLNNDNDTMIADFVFVDSRNKDTSAFVNTSKRFKQLRIVDEEIAPGVCCICFDPIDNDHLVTMPCNQKHTACRDCLLEWITNCLTDKDGAHIPACPAANSNQENHGCNHLMSELEVVSHLEFLVDPVQRHNFHEKIQELYYGKVMRDMGCVRCPKCPVSDDREACWVLPSDDGWTNRVACTYANCGVSFCAKCSASPYHHRCKCDEVMIHTENWRRWLNTGMQEYLDSTQQKVSDVMAKDIKQRMKEANARHKELENMERYKAAHCRYCPHCKRIVEKTGGCNTMLCGRNYHGGEVQDGCGKKFGWNAAERYTPVKMTKPNLDSIAPKNKKASAQELKERRHAIEQGQNKLCDNCRKDIIGPLIRCMNCAAVELCMNCSVLPRFKKTNAARDHTCDHICEVDFGSSIASDGHDNYLPPIVPEQQQQDSKKKRGKRTLVADPPPVAAPVEEAAPVDFGFTASGRAIKKPRRSKDYVQE